MKCLYPYFTNFGKINGMKRYFILVMILFTSLAIQAQGDNTRKKKDTLADFMRMPYLPAFRIMRFDSTYITKASLKQDKHTIVMLFSPDCEHCQHQTEDLIKHMDELKEVQFIMTTYQPMENMKRFYEKYQLAKYPDIHMGRDTHYFFGPFYKIKSIPFLAFYDKKQDLMKVFDGGAPIGKITEVIRNSN
jgi:thioredoxin-related protein